MFILLWILIALMSLVAILVLIIPLLIARLLFSSLAILLLLPFFALWIYGHWGSAEALRELIQQQEQALQVKHFMTQFNSPQQVIEQLQQRLKAHPESAQGWYLLGKLYLDQQDYPQALSSLKRAHHLSPHQFEFMIAYAQALFFSKGRLLNLKAKALLEESLRVEPHNPDALNLLAMGAYNAGDYVNAIHYWEQLLPLLEPNSKEQKLVLELIAEAQKKE